MKAARTDKGARSEFTPSDELALLQLRTFQYLFGRTEQQDAKDKISGRPRTSRPADFSWNIGREPYRWQFEALDAWRAVGRKGIVKVVTGAGKTVMAFQAMEDAFRQNPELRVSIVVPTVVLLQQWYQEIIDSSNIAEDIVGRHGGGHEQSFRDGKRIVVWVINSAARLLVEDVETAHVGGEHLLIVDECHRAGAPEFRRIFEASRCCTLGLSATPEREDPESLVEADTDVREDGVEQLSVLSREIGPVIFQLSFSQAVEAGIIPKFEVLNLAVDLTPQERARYDRLSRELRDLEDELKSSDEYWRIQSRAANQFQIFRAIAQRAKDARTRIKAARYETLTTERRRLLYQAKNRESCFQNLLQTELNAGAQVIVFHEVIDTINSLYGNLARRGLPVVLYHSQLPDSFRDDAIKLYLERTARVIISARALIEGFNVPSTDVGIILASSSSPRQRIQTIGRVLRRYQGKECSRIYNIYVHDSADEYSFMRQSWDKIVGAASVSYARWRAPGMVESLAGPPYVPLPAEEEVDQSTLLPGSPYPGAFEGEDVSVDYQGRVFRQTAKGIRQYAAASALGRRILELKGSPGTFKITPARHNVLIRRQVGERDWQTILVAQLGEPLIFEEESPYSEYRYSQKFGGALIRRANGLDYFDNKSPSAKEIIAAVQGLPRGRGWPLPSRVYVSQDRRQVYVRDPDGMFSPICELDQPFEIGINKEGDTDGIEKG